MHGQMEDTSIFLPLLYYGKMNEAVDNLISNIQSFLSQFNRIFLVSVQMVCLSTTNSVQRRSLFKFNSRWLPPLQYLKFLAFFPPLVSRGSFLYTLTACSLWLWSSHLQSYSLYSMLPFFLRVLSPTTHMSLVEYSCCWLIIFLRVGFIE